MKVDLVFEGGGVLGISFVGAYKALKEQGYEVERCAGTSAGSIISALIIAGYTDDELITLLNTTNFSQFMKETKLSRIKPLGKAFSLIFNKGIYNYHIIESWMNDLLAKKGIQTFSDVMVNGESRLKIIAADITDRKMLILPNDIKNYGIKPEDFSIAKAVAMSCSIPLFFTPIKLTHNDQLNFIVDGGLLSTFPIWIYDVEGTPRWPTLGFKIEDESSLSSQGKTSIFSYIKDLINAAIYKEENFFIKNKDLVRTILIENANHIKSTDFNLKQGDIDYLYRCGYKSTKRFFKNWAFTEYVMKYRL